MVRGIGVDMVRIERVDHILHKLSEGAIRRMFAESELKQAELKARPAEYLAGRFAVKEAVFKALAPLLPEKIFDFRIVETLNHEDGSPYVVLTEALKAVMKQASVTTIFVSITTEGDYATAFVTATDEPAF